MAGVGSGASLEVASGDEEGAGEGDPVPGGPAVAVARGENVGAELTGAFVGRRRGRRAADDAHRGVMLDLEPPITDRGDVAREEQGAADARRPARPDRDHRAVRQQQPAGILEDGAVPERHLDARRGDQLD